MSYALSQMMPTRVAGVLSPAAFVLSRTKWTIRIAPRTASGLFKWSCLAVIPLASGLAGVLMDQVLLPTCVVFAGICAFFAKRALDRLSLGRGSWFIFRLADGIVELPRLNVSIPRFYRKEFHLIAPQPTGGRDGTELTLVAWDTAGNPSRYPLVRGTPRLAAGEMDRLVKALSKATAIPICRPGPHATAVDCPCEKCGSDLSSACDRCAECGHQFLILTA